MNDKAERMKKIQERRKRITERMHEVKHKFVVLSGKGGVGKSTVAAYLASALAARGHSVGLLDTDIHGPSIPKMVGVEGSRITIDGDTIMPIDAAENLKVMSIAFLLRSKGDAVIWRGPMKMTMIEEFLANVEWGKLDYLIIDSPPGTGDEPLSVVQFLPDLDGAIIVATPQEIALNDVEKSITFCQQVNIPVAGVIENMSGYVCPHCNERVDIFKSGGAEHLAARMGVPFLGRLPLVPGIVEACDAGRCSYEGARNAGLKDALDEITSKLTALEGSGAPAVAGGSRKIALPLDGDAVSAHFGHSPEFAVFDVSGTSIAGSGKLTAPPHSPGAIPRWLKESGIDVVIAGGIGNRAVGMLESSGIEVVTGAPPGRPEDLVMAYLAGTLETGENVCDH
jgi:Mrp family chromosome partitioning ATPase/predicted Fe-Mo cluster-binding NifX family protein